MKDYLKSPVSWFASYIETEPAGVLTVANVLAMMRDGTHEVKIDQVRKVTDKKARDEAKKRLPAYTLSGRFSARKNEALVEHSGVVCLDVDKAGDPEENREALRNHPSVLAVGRSASGVHSFVVVPVSPVPTSPAEHREAFDQVCDLLGLGAVDNNLSDVSRLRGCTYDPDLYINPDAEPVRVTYAKPEAKNGRPVRDRMAADRDPVQECREVLSYITDRPGYDDWIRISSGVLAKVGGDIDTAEALLIEWRPEEVPGEYRRKLENPLGKIGFGSVVHRAKAYGYDPTRPAKVGRPGGDGAPSRPGIPVSDPDFSPHDPTVYHVDDDQVGGGGEEEAFTFEAFEASVKGLAGDALSDKVFEIIDQFSTLPKSFDSKAYLILKKARMTARDLQQWQKGVKDTRKERETQGEKASEDLSKGIVPKLGDHFLGEDHFAVNVGSRLYYYEDGAYRPGGHEYLSLKIKAMLEEWGAVDLWSRYRVDEVVAYIKMHAPRLWEEYPADRRNWINILSGLLDLETGEHHPHSSDFLSAVQFPITYEPDADALRWEEFFRDVFPPDAYEKGVHWEIACWVLMNTNPAQKAILFQGPGDGGKSRALEAFKSLVGRGNTSRLSLQTMGGNRFAASAIIGKALNICADLPSAHLADTSLFKMIVGGDEIGGEYKGGDFFEFSSRCKLMFSANEIPSSSDNSEGFFRRWDLVPMTNRIDPAKRKPAADLDEALASPEELSGVLNHVLRVAPRVIKKGVTVTGTMKRAHEDFMAAVDSFAAWARNNIVTENEGRVSFAEIMRQYKESCKDRDIKPRKPETCKEAITKRYPRAVWGEYTDQYANSFWGYCGIKLTTA